MYVKMGACYHNIVRVLSPQMDLDLRRSVSSALVKWLRHVMFSVPFQFLIPLLTSWNRILNIQTHPITTGKKGASLSAARDPWITSYAVDGEYEFM